MKFFLWCATALAVAFPLAACQAQGSACGDYKTVVAELKDRYKETSIALGLLDNGSVLQIFQSKDGKTFTVLAVQPTGVACVLSSGHHLELTLPLPGIPV